VNETPAAAVAKPDPRPPVPGALFAVVVLTAMNLLNYIDRWIPSAVKLPLMNDLKLSGEETGDLLTAFVWVYMIASPVFASLAGRMSRKILIAAGVAIWSIASAAGAFAHDYWSLMAARAMVGIGEAAYATIAPALLADYFAPDKRNRIFTIFYIATPVGSAIGFTLGGVLDSAFGWRSAFLICGLPGLLAAALALFIKEPPRGNFDEDKGPEPSWPAALKALATNKLYIVTVAGYTAITFATGAVTDWFATYVVKVRGMELAKADTLVGIAAVIGGIVGTLVGGLVGDWLKGRTRHPYLAVSALSSLPAAIFVGYAIYGATDPTMIAVGIVIGMIFFLMYNAPINALIVNSVDAGLRARAFGLSILSIHLLGDAASPKIVGKIYDGTGDLGFALGLAPVFIVVGLVIWLVGWRTLAEPSTAAEPKS
jgi:predicted MFS family arabinose efflux permease